MENDYKINFENNSLDEEFVKKGINEDLKNEIFNKISDSNFKFDPNIHFVEDPEFIFKLDYNKSHPFDNQCKFPVIRHGKFDFNLLIFFERVNANVFYIQTINFRVETRASDSINRKKSPMKICY